MPSGGHGGGGGSHFGGSSGGGGSHFGGSSGGSYHDDNYRRRPTYIRHGRSVYVYHFGGRPYYMSTHAAGFLPFLFTLFFIFAFASIFLFVSSSSTNNAKIQTIINHHNYYIEMIDDAKADSNLMIQGKVVNYYEYEDSGKYYITYSFEVPSAPGKWVNGESYTIYTHAQASKLWNDYNAGGFDIAIPIPKTSITASNYTSLDSVNADYENFSLEDDYEYEMLQKSASSIRITKVAFTAVSVVLLVVIILIFAKNLKKDDEKEAVETSTVSSTKVSKKCKYCGSTLKEGETKCPNCGGSTK